jgi:hypothetical protein
MELCGEISQLILVLCICCLFAPHHASVRSEWSFFRVAFCGNENDNARVVAKCLILFARFYMEVISIVNSAAFCGES